MLDEKRRWNGEFPVGSTSPMAQAKKAERGPAQVMPPPDAPSASSSSSSSSTSGLSEVSASGSASATADLAVSPSRAASTWQHFQPSSPSPLSPAHYKTRSPRTHVAGKRKQPKTPLSRLVLEKAVLHRDGKAASGSSGVFGSESTRRANVELGKGKTKTGSGSGTIGAATTSDLKASTRKLGQSIGAATASSMAKRELAVSQGVGTKGAAAAKSGKVWR